MHRNFLAFFGHVAIDVTMGVEFLPKRGTVGVNRLEENFGGTAGNFAMVAARLDVPFHLYSAVSAKTHSNYLNFLRSIGVDTSHIIVDDGDLGPIGYAATTGKEQIYYFYQGPMASPLTDRIEIKQMDYKYVHLGTGLPKDFLKVGNIAKDSCIVFDPGQEISYRYGREDLEALLAIAQVTLLNEEEAKIAAKILETDRSGLQEKCKKMIVTRGSKGATYFEDGRRTDFGTVKVEKPYDTIGAGDAFRAGIYFSLFRGMDLKDGVVIGTITSSEAIKKPIRDFSLNADKLISLYKENRDRLILD